MKENSNIEKMKEIIERCKADESFRERLSREPEVVMREMGIDENEELNLEELDSIAGGYFDSSPGSFKKWWKEQNKKKQEMRERFLKDQRDWLSKNP